MSNDVVGAYVLRVFVAIDMPRLVCKEVERVQSIIKKQGLLKGVYGNSEQAHLTLQFIGFVEPPALEKIKKLLKKITVNPIHAQLDGIGFFENKGHVTVVWLGVIAEGIEELARQIKKTVFLDLPIKTNKFHPHIMLARVHSVEDVNVLQKKIKTLEVKPLEFTIDSFSLKQSILTDQGPLYVDLQKYKSS